MSEDQYCENRTADQREFYESLRALAVETYGMRVSGNKTRPTSVVHMLSHVLEEYIGVKLVPEWARCQWRVDPQQTEKNQILAGLTIVARAATPTALWQLVDARNSDAARPAAWFCDGRAQPTGAAEGDDDDTPPTIDQGVACKVDVAAVKGALDLAHRPPYCLHLRPGLSLTKSGPANNASRWLDSVRPRHAADLDFMDADDERHKEQLRHTLTIDFAVLSLAAAHTDWREAAPSRPRTGIGVHRFHNMHRINASLSTCSEAARDIVLGPSFARVDLVAGFDPIRGGDIWTYMDAYAATIHAHIVMEDHHAHCPELVRLLRTPPRWLSRALRCALADEVCGRDPTTTVTCAVERIADQAQRDAAREACDAVGEEIRALQAAVIGGARAHTDATDFMRSLRRHKLSLSTHHRRHGPRRWTSAPTATTSRCGVTEMSRDITLDQHVDIVDRYSLNWGVPKPPSPSYVVAYSTST